MIGIRQQSIRVSGLLAEAKLTENMTGEEIAQAIGISDRTLRSKSREKDLCTLSFEKIIMLAQLAGYEIEFRKVAG